MRAVVGLTILVCSAATALLLVRNTAQRPAHSPLAQPVSSSGVGDTAPRTPATVVPRGDHPPVVLPEPHAWSHSLCPAGMFWVGGRYCPKPREGGASGCASDERTVAVCMDPHEYPSQVGVFPAVMLDFRAAAGACDAEGKRLCTETEWSFACESTREVAACNLGLEALKIRTQELAKPDRVSVEIAEHEGRRTNGENACVNGFRVFDLLGNVQEWVISEHKAPHVGALKGGRYNQGSIGCTRSIYVSDPWTRYPHTGLRCCADPLAPAPTSP